MDVHVVLRRKLADQHRAADAVARVVGTDQSKNPSIPAADYGDLARGDPAYGQVAGSGKMRAFGDIDGVCHVPVGPHKAAAAADGFVLLIRRDGIRLREDIGIGREISEQQRVGNQRDARTDQAEIVEGAANEQADGF